MSSFKSVAKGTFPMMIAVVVVMLLTFVFSGVLAMSAHKSEYAVVRGLVARMSLVGLLVALLIASLPDLVRSVREAVAPCDCGGQS